MLPAFIAPEQSVDANGNGEAVELGDAAGRMLLLTLGITDIVEQESLDISIAGSADGEEWEEGKIREFPQKFYRGTSSILLDLSQHTDMKFVRVEWVVHRWGVGSKTPMFKFYVFAERFADSAAA